MADLVKQSNSVTFARYEYTVWEKRIIYKLFEILQKIEINDYSQSLPVFFPLYELAQNKDHYRHIKEALKTLRDKSFEIDDGKSWAVFGFINDAKIREDDKMVHVEVNRNIVAHLKGLLQQYTTYNLMIAYTLKSTYSQRFYEFCNSYKDKGKFFFHEKKLRKILKAEDKYAMFAAFRKYVLDIAEKELKTLYEKGLCDICFSYSLEKDRKTKEHKINFNIYKKEQIHSLPADELTEFRFIVESIWPDNLVRQNKAIENLTNCNANLQDVLAKISELQDRMKKPISEIGGLIVKSLDEDLNIKI